MRNGNNPEKRLSKAKPAGWKRAERERMRSYGFVSFQTWVHKDHLEKVRTNTARLRARKMPSDEEG